MTSFKPLVFFGLVSFALSLGAYGQDRGKALFEAKCSACHKIDEDYVGPALSGVTKRRTPEWIMSMILTPGEMTRKDPIAKELLAKYLTQMTFQNVSQTEARQILEYFRRNDSGKGAGK